MLLSWLLHLWQSFAAASTLPAVQCIDGNLFNKQDGACVCNSIGNCRDLACLFSSKCLMQVLKFCNASLAPLNTIYHMHVMLSSRATSLQAATGSPYNAIIALCMIGHPKHT